MKSSRIGLILLTMLLLIAGTLGQTTTTPRAARPEATTVIAPRTSQESQPYATTRIALLSMEEGFRLARRLGDERNELQTKLVLELDESNTIETNCIIASILGFQRMTRAVPRLSKFIKLEWVPKGRESLPPWGRYPVVDALVNIGNTAIPEMIKNIETSDDEKVRQLSAEVIKRVETAEIAKIIIEKAAQRQTDETKRERLRAAALLMDA